MFTKRIEEHAVDGRRLGRHVAHDPRSKNYPARRASTIQNVWHKVDPGAPLPLDQGNRGSCTAQALCGALDCHPYFSPLQTEADANHYYDQEIVLEGGNPQTDDPGGTGLYICQVAKSDGLITSYEHAFGLQHALEALMLTPVITGVNWYEGFDNPTPNGTVRIAGQVRGGHEFVVVAIDVADKRVACWNSWSTGYGSWGGRFWMPWSAWDRLLGESGDVTVPVV